MHCARLPLASDDSDEGLNGDALGGAMLDRGRPNYLRNAALPKRDQPDEYVGYDVVRDRSCFVGFDFWAGGLGAC